LSYPDIAQQTIGEPLASPWYTPGWTSQDPAYQVIPETQFNIAGFPTAATYVTVTANYFDDDGNPISGFLTFYPSSALTFTYNSVTTVIPQRFVGRNLWDVPGAYWGTGHMYLHNGNLLVNLLATDNAGVNMSPVNFTYSVVENWLGGRSYTITVPSASTSPADINSLIIPGSIILPDSSSNLPLVPDITVSIAAISTVYLPANISASIGGISFNPTSDEVDFAFISGSAKPQSGDWNTGSWIVGGPPYIAEILIGPENSGLVLPVNSYTVWCRVVATPQVPIFPVGTLIIY